MFNDSLPTDVIPGGSDEEQQYVSVQVEHVDDQETEIVGNDVNDTVQHSPPVLQPQDEPIAHRRTKRSNPYAAYDFVPVMCCVYTNLLIQGIAIINTSGLPCFKIGGRQLP
jgi:hypothetical protein